MNDVEKTNIERTNSGKRMRRRKRMMSVYAAIVFLLVATAGVTMCFTFLFNIDNIVVSGESDTYEYMDIVRASGINAGDNLLRLDTKKAEQKILDKLLNVETASVSKDFPSTLRIHVTRCISAYNIRYDTGVLLVSKKGKILSDGSVYTEPDKLLVIHGYDPADKTPGNELKSVNPNKEEAFAQLISHFDRDENTQIASIDLTNEYDIIVTYRDGMIFKMGNWSDIDYKLDLAQNVMNDENVKGKSGYLTMIGRNQCSFRSSGEKEVLAATEAAADILGEQVTESNAAVSNDDTYGF